MGTPSPLAYVRGQDQPGARAAKREPEEPSMPPPEKKPCLPAPVPTITPPLEAGSDSHNPNGHAQVVTLGRKNKRMTASSTHHYKHLDCMPKLLAHGFTILEREMFPTGIPSGFSVEYEFTYSIHAKKDSDIRTLSVV
ncbi:unnamed protein product [Prorocentrum cordatum]|uniref:Uncharacterized protein n=1 Tax=Prorocentrum cordatum TaxID=2364126 RepID=A0ABN9SGU3_9DINO|nr:unnamed protein product [Polarella glacialis]